MEHNILKWYPFKKNSKIFIYGDEKINTSEKYDYIAFIGCLGKDLKLIETLKEYEKFLKDDGIFLVAVDNKFGIRFFAGNPEKMLNEKFASLDGYYSRGKKIETYTRKYLENNLSQNGYKFNFYYPLPDYKIPNVIFSDKSLPDFNSFDRYLPYHEDNASIIMNELDVFREILKDDKNQFTFFTNSFFLEISRKEITQKYNYISYNNIRKPEYRLVTKITDKYAEKDIDSIEAKEHLENIKKNIEIIKNKGLNILDYEEDGVIKSKYIEQNLRLDNYLINLIKTDKEKAEEIIDRYINILKKDTFKEENYDNTIFAKYDVEIENKEILKDMHFVKDGLFDLIFQNCFYIDDDFYFFDQEWNEKNVPIEYIYYRAIFYTLPLREYVYKDNWISNKLEIRKYLKIFEQLDYKIQRSFYNEDMWGFYHNNKNYDLDATKQEVLNLNTRIDALQAAFDELKKNHEDYVNKIHNNKMYKVYSKIKRINGGKNE